MCVTLIYTANISTRSPATRAVSTFSLTANHRKQVLHSTRGGPSRWNDQTYVRFDEFVSGIWEGRVLKDFKFELYERDKNGNVITVEYRGGYVICDNGYLRWSVRVPPFKVINLQHMKYAGQNRSSQ